MILIVCTFVLNCWVLLGISGGQLSSLELKVDEILALDPPPQDTDSREEEHMATVRKKNRIITI